MPARRHQSLNTTPWATPSRPVLLPKDGQVHLWRLSFTTEPRLAIPCKGLLSQKELARARRFHYTRDYNTYVVTRGVLRHLVGKYLHHNPKSIRFTYGPYGKPFIAEDSACGLQFNVSHAGGYALIGFTTGRAIGVDLEVEDPIIGVEQLTQRFFSPSERNQLLSLPPGEQQPAFFRTWTRKEAFLKANGAGLSLPLDQFSVTIDLGEPVRVERVDWAPEEVNEWALTSFMVARRVPGAVVVGGNIEEPSPAFYDVPVSDL